MRTREIPRESWIGLVLILAVAGGLTFSGLTDDVSSRSRGAGSDLLMERALFCPPMPSVAEATVHLTAGSLGGDDVEIGFEPGFESPKSVGDSILTKDISDGRPLDVIGFGGALGASAGVTFRKPLPGLAAMGCAVDSAVRWYFPGGSSAPGYNEHIVLYNPFPDEAVVKLVLYTPNGVRSKANLADIAVPSFRTVSVKINDFILQQRVLGVGVRALRGRVSAWKVMFASPDSRPNGTGATLGATRPANTWFFPGGSVGPGADERITILNPGDDEAVVSVSLVTDDEVLQPSRLVEVKIPRASSVELDLNKAVKGKDLGGVSAVVRSANEKPVIAERAVWYRSSAFHGYSTEIGAPAASTRWWVGPPASKPAVDSLVLLNTSADDATVDLSLRRVGGSAVRPKSLQGLSLPAGERLRVSLPGTGEQRLAAVVVEASQEIVAERLAYSSAAGDVAAIMGQPIPAD